ncbi:uncharacterized protein CLUP02_09367 [Colletotrichum lupini]|uniref:Uncharacterized protein n=1 Tax=Colletotrichum lupini TaxID=145971 RepID=A0A9Q8WHW1_9PEZI|nr:uncharacterized protein CLUP02_09367 [Colletotrichum lupini]UQC83871.1 hypothetical protein CLUP02_09367 [Colletotrichum lupini]
MIPHWERKNESYGASSLSPSAVSSDYQEPDGLGRSDGASHIRSESRPLLPSFFGFPLADSCGAVESIVLSDRCSPRLLPVYRESPGPVRPFEPRRFRYLRSSGAWLIVKCSSGAYRTLESASPNTQHGVFKAILTSLIDQTDLLTATVCRSICSGRAGSYSYSQPQLQQPVVDFQKKPLGP